MIRRSLLAVVLVGTGLTTCPMSADAYYPCVVVVRDRPVLRFIGGSLRWIAGRPFTIGVNVPGFGGITFNNPGNGGGNQGGGGTGDPDGQGLDARARSEEARVNELAQARAEEMVAERDREQAEMNRDMEVVRRLKRIEALLRKKNAPSEAVVERAAPAGASPSEDERLKALKKLLDETLDEKLEDVRKDIGDLKTGLQTVKAELAKKADKPK